MSAAKIIPNYTVVKLAVSQLRPSEEINLDHGRTLAEVIAEEGRWTQPILVELRHRVIMDGHHRHFSAKALGLWLVPCVLLSYDDPNLHVTYWSDSAPVDVGKIIHAGLSGHLMNFKTTRHELKDPLPRCSIHLDDLR